MDKPNKQKSVNPIIQSETDGYGKMQYIFTSENGLTKLEYFTAKAMNGLLSNPRLVNNSMEYISDYSIKIAEYTLTLLSLDSLKEDFKTAISSMKEETEKMKNDLNK